MSDETVVCAAAFFRIRGKEFVTEKEFTMCVSLDLKWMSVKEARFLEHVLLRSKAVVLSDGYLKPAADYSDVQVPIAYRPSAELKKMASEYTEKDSSGTSAPKMKDNDAAPADMFPEMVKRAADNGVDRKKFISECNSTKKALGIEICAAALLVLRDCGTDITGLSDKVYAQISHGC